jgi:DNA repair exonuclease SbcCD nuclease subunit
MKKLSKAACFTDLHWGCKTNSEVHNQDCLNYINWFCNNVKQDPSIDHIFFLGDWFENRSAINISTLSYAYKGATLLNELNLPIYFITGNHDLYHKHSREIYSTIQYAQHRNFKLFNEPTIVDEIADGVLVSPFLFHEEYPTLLKYLNIPTWWGHFEFKGFQITGYNITMPSGPDPDDFVGPKHIVSGHFHKRQAAKNVVYMGNTFPTNFSDADDFNRGMMVYDHVTDQMVFHDWVDCPKYIKTTLSNILDNNVVLPPESRVKCVIDIPITFEESAHLRQTVMDKSHLREFTMEESAHITEALVNTQTTANYEDIKLASVDDLVIQMLSDINTDHIDNQLLVQIYQEIKV